MTRPEKKIINTDEKWCINQGVNLTFEKYAIRFGCTDKQKAYRRYAEIVHHVAEGALKEKLVCDFANWKDSLQQHQFWLDRTLVKQSLKARKEGANVLGTNIRRAAADIKGLGKRKAQGEVDESEDLRRNMLNRAEHDGVFVELLGKSVGTIIKQEALKIYGVWAHGDELTPYGRKNMCLGLSSILDTIDTTENGQRTFFRSHWDTVTKRFSDDYSLKPLALPDTVAETLEIISAICLESRHAKDALEYIHHILATPLEEKERNLLRILEEILFILQYDREYVASNSNNKLTEQDYQSNIWSPILRHLLRSTSNPKIRVKAGESIFQYTTDQKKHCYSDSSNVVGYKIDMRIIADVDGEECDIGACEVAKTDTVKKIIDDEAKLLREGKDVVDHLARLPLTEVCPMGWVIQIANCQCQLSSIHLAADGLYVAIPQFEQLTLPKCFRDLGCLAATLKALYTMEDSLRKIADLLPAAYNNREQLGTHLGHKSSVESSRAEWTRGTFYSPPTSVLPHLPEDIFKHRPSGLMSKLTKAKPVDELPKHLEGMLTDDLVPDKYGWVYVPQLKKYYNLKAKVLKDVHPISAKQTSTIASSSSRSQH